MTYQNAQLDALGDGTRRGILSRLLSEGPLSVKDIACQFRVTRPAISQHLRILKEAELVKDERAGTRRVYELDPHGFQLVRQYFDAFWTEALFAFKQKAEEASTTRGEPPPRGERRGRHQGGPRAPRIPRPRRP